MQTCLNICNVLLFFNEIATHGLLFKQVWEGLGQKINYYQLIIGFLRERHHANSNKTDTLMKE